MKIIEIVDTTINEASPFSSAAKFITGLGAKALGVGERSAKIDRLAAKYRPDYVMQQKDFDKIRIEFPNENADKVAKEILQRSGTIRNLSAAKKNVERMSTRWDQIKNNVKRVKYLWGPLIGVELVTILWEPFAHYIERMDLAEQWLNAKDESERWTEAQYNQFHHSELMALIEKLARLFITYKVLKLPGRALNIFGKNFGDAFNRLTTPVRLWVTDELSSSKEFSDKLPILALEQLLGEQYITNMVGKYLVDNANSYVFDRIKQAAEDRKKAEQDAAKTTAQPNLGVKPAAPNTQQPATSTSTGTTQEPVKKTQKTTLELLKPYNPEDWEYYSQQLVKHKPTGTFHPKAVVDRFK